MRRRDFVVLLGGAASAAALQSLTAKTQPAAKPWRIGFIVAGKALPTDGPYSAFAQGMRELGYSTIITAYIY